MSTIWLCLGHWDVKSDEPAFRSWQFYNPLILSIALPFCNAQSPLQRSLSVKAGRLGVMKISVAVPLEYKRLPLLLACSFTLLPFLHSVSLGAYRPPTPCWHWGWEAMGQAGGLHRMEPAHGLGEARVCTWDSHVYSKITQEEVRKGGSLLLWLWIMGEPELVWGVGSQGRWPPGSDI